MEDTQKQILGALEKANNVLVTVSRNPSVDQLSAAIGLTLSLNKLGKHAIAVFSGEVPSTIDFLKPEKTLEKNTDSLRDFIISLDKNKADKLRYKVEDDMVKIFITPYKTSLSQDDLEFSQGDFNVEVVMALGVHEQTELDQAITAHGRILHDATVVGVTVSGDVHLGNINWVNPTSSSLSEMLAAMVPKLKENLLDEQIATAFLTGIVAETERFSNDKTSPDTMQVSSQLMAAGANQQLVATQLDQPAQATVSTQDGGSQAPVPKPHHDGALEIPHHSANDEVESPEPEANQNGEIHIDEHGQLGEHPGEQPVQSEPTDQPANQESEPALDESEESAQNRRPMALTPPVTGGKLTANIEPEGFSPSTDVLGDGVVRSSEDRPNLSRREPVQPAAPSLEDIEKSVSSPHVDQTSPDTEPTPPVNDPGDVPLPSPTPEEPATVTVEPEPPITPPEPEAPSPELSQPSDTPPLNVDASNPLEDARNAVMAAMDGNGQPVPDAGQQATPINPEPATLPEAVVSEDGTLSVHPESNPEPYGPPVQPNVTDANAPPEVPPPFMPPNYPPNDQQNPQ